jgi:hypothetical protein
MPPRSTPNLPRKKQTRPFPQHCLLTRTKSLFPQTQFISHININLSPSLPDSSPASSSPRQHSESPKPSSQRAAKYGKARADTSQSLEAPPSALSEEISASATSMSTAAAPSFSSSQRDASVLVTKIPEEPQPHPATQGATNFDMVCHVHVAPRLAFHTSLKHVPHVISSIFLVVRRSLSQPLMT